VLECVLNLSEGRRLAVVDALARTGGRCVLDVHADPWHNRSVVTLAGPPVDLAAAVRGVAGATVTTLDLSSHTGEHPRMGVLDVVPWVDLDQPMEAATPASLAARDHFARWATETLGLPCYTYGPERSLPELRQQIGRNPNGLHGAGASAGACAVGARAVLIAYNIWLDSKNVTVAKAIARSVRSPSLRTLGLTTGRQTQVSCNLTAPWQLGPAEAFDRVRSEAHQAGVEILRAELVGLLPDAILGSVGPARWRSLDLDPSRTIEARLEEAGW